MQLERLSIINYRNIESAELELSPGISCMVGPNGAGKTNILDTIYYLSFCKSLTGLPDSLNIRHNEPFFVIQGTYNLSAAPQLTSKYFRSSERKFVLAKLYDLFQESYTIPREQINVLRRIHMDIIAFGNRVRAARERLGITQ